MLSVRARLRAATRDLPRVFWALWWGILLNRVASFVAAFLALYLVRDRGFSASAAGRVIALYGIGVTLSGPIGGALADRYGRRATMLLGLALAAGSVGALAFARAPAVVAGLAFAAALSSLYGPAANAAIADVVGPEERSRAWALVYWAVNVGLSLGLFAAGLFADRSLPALFLADAATTVGFAAVVLRHVPETRPPGVVPGPLFGGMGEVLRDRPFVTFLFLHLCALGIFTQWVLGLPLDMAAHGFGPSALSVLMALNCLGVVLLQPLLTPWLRRFDGAHLLATSTLLFGLGYGVNAFGGNVPIYAVGTALWTVGEVVGFPVASALVADLAPPAMRGRYQGAFSMTWGATFALSPAVSGEILGRFGARTLWVGCLLVGVTVAAAHLAVAEPRRRAVTERSPR